MGEQTAQTLGKPHEQPQPTPPDGPQPGRASAQQKCARGGGDALLPRGPRWGQPAGWRALGGVSHAAPGWRAPAVTSHGVIPPHAVHFSVGSTRDKHSTLGAWDAVPCGQGVRRGRAALGEWAVIHGGVQVRPALPLCSGACALLCGLTLNHQVSAQRDHVDQGHGAHQPRHVTVPALPGLRSGLWTVSPCLPRTPRSSQRLGPDHLRQALLLALATLLASPTAP